MPINVDSHSWETVAKSKEAWGDPQALQFILNFNLCAQNGINSRAERGCSEHRSASRSEWSRCR